MRTYPNQKIIHIQKKDCENDFLKIGRMEWQKAARDLSGPTFKLYLYLAGNRNGFDIALSQKDVEDTIGLPKNTYHRSVDELSKKGYLCHDHGNVFVFLTSQTDVSTQSGYIPKTGTTQNGYSIYPKWGEVSTQNGYSILPKMGRETDKTYNTDKTNSAVDNSIFPEGEDVADVSVIKTIKKKETEASHDVFISGDGLPRRRIRDLSDKEAKEIKEKIAAGTQYQKIEQEYGMRSGTITKDFGEHWKMFMYALVNNKL